MRIVFTGGGSGGHFYPIIAVAEKCVELIEKERIVDARMYFFGPSPYNKKALFDNGVRFVAVPAGKMHRGFSPLIPVELLKTALGFVRALFSLWSIYPDVVFGKGGYGSFPTLLAARILNIPVVIHESDSVPGRTNVWAGKFAKRIALSYAEAAEYFPKEKTAYTGQPVRKEIASPASHGAFEFLHLDPSVPVVFILGGSQGAQMINEVVLDILPELVEKYQIIHQTGNMNLKNVEETASIILEKNKYKNRYKTFGYLNDISLRMSAGASSIALSRAGSGIFEIAGWGIPSIIIPITDSNGDHQRKNAFNYARSGAAIVMEERNLAPHVLLSEINKLMENETEMGKMKKAALSFNKPDAAEKIGKELISIALSHESR